MKRTFKNNNTKYRSESSQNLTIEQYLQKIRSYLHGIINNFNISNERKVQITNKLEFMSSKDTNEKSEMYITTSNLEKMIGEDTNKIIKEYFDSVLHIYQDDLKTIKGSEFMFDFA